MKVRSALIATAAVLCAQAASAAIVPFSGALANTDQTFNRPQLGNPPSGLSVVGTSVFYDLFPFFVNITTSYSLETLSASFSPFSTDDTFMVLYQTAFNRLTPLANVLQTDDDAGPGLLSLITRTLNPGTQYFMVVTSFGNAVTGAYTGQIASTTGTATFGTLGGVVSTPSTLALVPLALAALALTRRRKVTTA